MNKQIISFTIEPELDEYLRKMANEAHVSISQYLRNLLWTGYEADKASTKTIDEIQRDASGRYRF